MSLTFYLRLQLCSIVSVIVCFKTFLTSFCLSFSFSLRTVVMVGNVVLKTSISSNNNTARVAGLEMGIECSANMQIERKSDKDCYTGNSGYGSVKNGRPVPVSFHCFLFLLFLYFRLS